MRESAEIDRILRKKQGNLKTPTLKYLVPEDAYLVLSHKLYPRTFLAEIKKPRGT